jgi:hypothetical protein
MRIRCFWRWEGKKKSEDGVFTGLCEGENGWRAYLILENQVTVSQKGGIMENLKLTLTLLAALEFKLDIVQAINESYFIIVDSFHLRF